MRALALPFSLRSAALRRCCLVIDPRHHPSSLRPGEQLQASLRLQANRTLTTRRSIKLASPRRRSQREQRNFIAMASELNIEVRPESYDDELKEKVEAVVQLFLSKSLEVPKPEVFSSEKQNFRMRSEFRVWRSDDDMFYAMFDPREPRKPVQIDSFPMASKRINELMPALLEEVRAVPSLKKKLFQANFLTTLSGEALVTLLYHNRLDAEWEEAARRMCQKLDINIVGRSRKQKVLVDRDFVWEKLNVNGRDLAYKQVSHWPACCPIDEQKRAQVEGSFSQPNAGIATSMIGWALDVTSRPPSDSAGAGTGTGAVDDDLLELYCGNGAALPPWCRSCLGIRQRWGW
ncbi:hypothetical protein CYMTET_17716 [Cymbomonas tetramitiformis]|uniref:Uncharacterized protein n=1 Tax=Cymbomonas tetramitiformis TaxID=36881 RepID=A0AAE0L6N2_9CHLO|nr:hypothetical protein CYMTET_17716 [Cymbomonas tetramitiformis]